MNSENLLILRLISCDYALKQLNIFKCVASIHDKVINKPVLCPLCNDEIITSWSV